MKFLTGIWVLFLRELKDMFTSPLIYIVTGLFCLMMGWLFFNYLMLAKELSSMTMTYSVLAPIFGNMNFIFIFLAPLLTMKLFAEEKKQNTIELLLMSRLGNLQIILGKMLASVVIVLFILSFTLVFPIILAFSGYHDWGIVGTCYLGISLSVICYISVGIFTSSLTENQIVAAILSFCILLGLLLLVMSVNATNNLIMGQIAQYLSVPFHYEGFVRGAVATHNIVYYFSFVGFFLYLTHKSLESRNW